MGRIFITLLAVCALACPITQVRAADSPIVEISPPSGLIIPGTETLDLTLTTAAPTLCAFSINEDSPFTSMTPFTQTAATRHSAALVLDTNPSVVNQVYVRCASNPEAVTTLQYRVRANVNPSFPRKGNLWGWWEWRSKGLEYMSRVDFWLGADENAGTDMQQLRALNPNVLIFTSINAVENYGLSDDYYLKDVNGKKIEVWPGAFRLNLTKKYVAEYQANYALQTLDHSNWQADGVFFDNVFLSQSWLTHDIYGHPVQVDADEDGLPDDPATLDAAWYAGVIHEIQTFRQLASGALLSGHALEIGDANIAAAFNGISVGFDLSNVLDKRDSFGNAWQKYAQWMTQARAPQITMFEAAPPYEISYGYDYDPLSKIPKPTLEFARTYYRYMRFGLAFTLMRDGYFAYEFGDTYHGNDWWYDELDYDLGTPLGDATRANIHFEPGPNQIENPDFETELGSEWNLWADTANGYAATLTRDTTTAASGNASARVNITGAGVDDWRIELAQPNRSFKKDVTYALTFCAKSSAPRNITASAQQQTPPWKNYGLAQRVTLGTNWQEFTLTFQANATVNDSRIQFFVGKQTGSVWIDNVRLTKGEPDVYERDFANGKVVLNATNLTQTIDVGTGYYRLNGTQAPRVQTVLDNTNSGFSTQGIWLKKKYDSGTWKASGPFYHDWGSNLMELTSVSGQARWKLPVDQADTFTISVWLPAAPRMKNWNTQATYEIVANGRVIASKVLDQTQKGNQWRKIARVSLKPTDNAFVRLRCAGKACAADALLLQSQGRYNDGSAVSDITLAPMDGILLRR